MGPVMSPTLAAWRGKAGAAGVPPYHPLSARQTQTGSQVPDTLTHLAAKAALHCWHQAQRWHGAALGARGCGDTARLCRALGHAGGAGDRSAVQRGPGGVAGSPGAGVCPSRTLPQRPPSLDTACRVGRSRHGTVATPT